MLFRSAQVQFVEGVLLEAARGFTDAKAEECFVDHHESTLAVTCVGDVPAAVGAHNSGGDTSTPAAIVGNAAGALV